MLSRTSGVLIALIAAGAAALLWFAVAADGAGASGAPTEGLLLGLWTVFYDTEAPSMRVLLAAVALAVLSAAGVALLDRRASNKSRRSSNPQVTPLAPKIIMAPTRGIFAGEVTVTVLIPAHNEERSLTLALSSLHGQSQPPDRIIVVADNCVDDTALIARQCGAEVFETRGNTKKKAGALNQALTAFLPGQGDNDVVMVMDADTTLDPGFLAAAVIRFTNDRALMALGGLFYGEEGSGLLGQLQRNEYVRYSREIARRRGRVFVLTGTASIFRPVALRAVAANRGGAIPGTPGHVYDTAALTEDNELTIALKSLGALMTSPVECAVVTEVMPTPGHLWRQRLRWQRGALENIGAYGVTSATLRYWSQQLAIGYSVIALGSFAALVALTALAVDTWVWFPFWLGIGGVFIVERVVSVWNGGWRARVLALLIVPEMLYDIFLDVVYVKAITDLTLGRQAQWNHVARPAAVAERTA